MVDPHRRSAAGRFDRRRHLRLWHPALLAAKLNGRRATEFEEELVKCDPAIWVGVNLAKPTRDGPEDGQGGRLDVEFEGLEVVVRK